MTAVALDGLQPGGFHDRADRMAHVGEPLTRPHVGDGGGQRRLAHIDEALRLGVDHTHPHGERGVTVPAVHDRPAVDADEVALIEADRAGDAMDHDIVGRGADHRGKAVVAEEVRRRSAPLEHPSAHPVEIERGDTGTNDGADRLVHLGDHLAGAPHGGHLGPAAPGEPVHARAARCRMSMAATSRVVTSSGEPTPSTTTSSPRRE